jgi:hypothetical protein
MGACAVVAGATRSDCAPAVSDGGATGHVWCMRGGVAFAGVLRRRRRPAWMEPATVAGAGDIGGGGSGWCVWGAQGR